VDTVERRPMKGFRQERSQLPAVSQNIATPVSGTSIFLSPRLDFDC